MTTNHSHPGSQHDLSAEGRHRLSRRYIPDKMRTVAQVLYGYSEDVGRGGLSFSDSDTLKKALADSIFVAYGARDAIPVKIAKRTLLPSGGRDKSRIYFSADTASSVDASFINGTMTRYLDYNDTFLSIEDAHPSDNIPPLLGTADARGLRGKDLLKAMKVAYEIQCALCDAASLRDRGWDQVTYLAISSAAGAASLLGLDETRFVNAINLAVSNNISLRQTRVGELSMWKGCTAGDATRNGLFAALLAEGGLTGPSAVFEGEMGFFNQVTGKFSLDLGRNRVGRTMIKEYPVEYRVNSAVEAALALRKLTGMNNIKKVAVDTFSSALRILVKDPEKLRPKTKETADHSMPYIIAYSLLYGAPDLNAYGRRYLGDRRILDLMGKMSFSAQARYDRIYPDKVPVKITLYSEGKRFEEEVLVPKGHYRDPFSWEDLKRKGMSILNDEGAVDDIIDVVRNMDRMDASEILDVMADVDS